MQSNRADPWIHPSESGPWREAITCLISHPIPHPRALARHRGTQAWHSPVTVVPCRPSLFQFSAALLTRRETQHRHQGASVADHAGLIGIWAVGTLPCPVQTICFRYSWLALVLWVHCCYFALAGSKVSCCLPSRLARPGIDLSRSNHSSHTYQDHTCLTKIDGHTPRYPTSTAAVPGPNRPRFPKLVLSSLALNLACPALPFPWLSRLLLSHVLGSLWLSQCCRTYL